ncbi:hypothetical protein GJV03_17365 [Acinetobacter sp. RIT698]|uniref:hypothetical protein n=1 Tax=Acinetobacter sp. RIT698 TaxID=2666192 RepID=UPI0012ACDFF8|nr:hypothetical protein [Acinetobacter sp. RIT698]MRT38935.1 hypothetical protein [Acinetobacter sp. RIT698]
MSNIKYIIRHNDFAYNDEWYETSFPLAGIIQAIYTDKAEAETEYKKLIVSALYGHDDLSNFDIGNGYAAEETYQELEQFVFKKTGKEYEIDDGIPELNIDDAFNFAQISGILYYQLIEIDDNKPIYIIWFNAEQDYLRGDHNNIFESQDENFNDLESDQFMFLFEDYFEEYIFNQRFDELSDSPELLKALVQSISAITYDKQDEIITEIDWVDLTFIQLKALNALLIQPFIEIRKINLEQLYQITCE